MDQSNGSEDEAEIGVSDLDVMFGGESEHSFHDSNTEQSGEESDDKTDDNNNVSKNNAAKCDFILGKMMISMIVKIERNLIIWHLLENFPTILLRDAKKIIHLVLT